MPRWRQDYWLWPLPPPGDLLIACESRMPIYRTREAALAAADAGTRDVAGDGHSSALA